MGNFNRLSIDLGTYCADHLDSNCGEWTTCPTCLLVKFRRSKRTPSPRSLSTGRCGGSCGRGNSGYVPGRCDSCSEGVPARSLSNARATRQPSNLWQGSLRRPAPANANPSRASGSKKSIPATGMVQDSAPATAHAIPKSHDGSRPTGERAAGSPISPRCMDISERVRRFASALRTATPISQT